MSEDDKQDMMNKMAAVRLAMQAIMRGDLDDPERRQVMIDEAAKECITILEVLEGDSNDR